MSAVAFPSESLSPELEPFAAELLESIRNSTFLDHEPVMDDMFRVSIDYIKKNYAVPEGLMLEFGVFDAKSINWVAICGWHLLLIVFGFRPFG
jgi:hypothetical protein